MPNVLPGRASKHVPTPEEKQNKKKNKTQRVCRIRDIYWTCLLARPPRQRIRTRRESEKPKPEKEDKD
jgi:hypothetical protein